jgi:heme o synthase
MSTAPLPLAGAARRPLIQELRLYLAVTDPRTVLLLVFTGVAAGLMAGGLHSPARLALIGLSLTLSSMGARAVANYIDRDIDALMDRTRRRPLPSGALAPGGALALGLGLIAAGLLVAAPFGWLVVLLIALGLADNLLVYARLTKRTSPLNIVLGAPSGGAPALVGYVALSGGVDFFGLMVAAFVVLWTPIHIWSLAIRYRDDYARAAVPMLPVVAGVELSARYVGYASIALALGTAIFVLGAGSRLLLPTSIVAAGLAGTLLAGSLWLVRRPTANNAWRLFKFTAPYLALLFALLAINSLLGGG